MPPFLSVSVRFAPSLPVPLAGLLSPVPSVLATAGIQLASWKLPTRAQQAH
jgi:hypothetical protein